MDEMDGKQVNIEHGTAGPSKEDQTHVCVKFNMAVDQLMFTPTEAVDLALKILTNAKKLKPSSCAGITWPATPTTKN